MSQVVLITGCSTGIGRNLAQRLAQAGYNVAASARNLDALDDLPAALKLSLDVTQPDSINQAVERAMQQFGRIDVLVNNAGYAVRGAVEEISEEQAQGIFDANVLGVMRMVRAVVPHMRRQKAGRIINLSSIAGKLVTPGNGVYSSTKFAVEALSDALRWELAPFGIQVVLVEPGPIRTHFGETVDKLSKELYILRGGSNTLYELRRGENFVWPLRFTSVLALHGANWKFQHMQFSFPTMYFPDVRILD
ncbi:MAG: SDR family oxidoreductase [Chloroflexota bacterium]